MKQKWKFHQRWRRRYFRLKGHKLYYAKDANEVCVYQYISISIKAVANLLVAYVCVCVLFFVAPTSFSGELSGYCRWAPTKQSANLKYVANKRSSPLACCQKMINCFARRNHKWNTDKKLFSGSRAGPIIYQTFIWPSTQNWLRCLHLHVNLLRNSVANSAQIPKISTERVGFFDGMKQCISRSIHSAQTTATFYVRLTQIRWS